MSGELITWHEIRGLLDTYADALDFRRWELLERLFDPGVRADWGPGSTSQVGRDAVIAYVRGWIEQCGTTHHQFTNHQIALAVDGETATASFRARNYHAGTGAQRGRFFETYSTFECQLRRSGQEWRVTDWRLRPHDRVFGEVGTDWR